MEVVCNYFSRLCKLAGSRTAILCMSSIVVVPVLGSLRWGDE